MPSSFTRVFIYLFVPNFLEFIAQFQTEGRTVNSSFEFILLNRFQIHLSGEDTKRAQLLPAFFPNKFRVSFEHSGSKFTDTFIKVSHTDSLHPIRSPPIYVVDQSTGSASVYQDYGGDLYELYVKSEGLGQATLIRNPSFGKDPFRLVVIFIFPTLVMGVNSKSRQN
jgi:hypothetical protein